MNPAICLLFLPSMVLRAQSQQSILLRPYFQKFSTFYSIRAPELPDAAISSNLTVTATDHDGLGTAIDSAAECFRYAVTKSPRALAQARKTIEAVLFLEQVTGRPGYPARSYITAEETRPGDGVWHWTAERKYLWKGDTSSDEIAGHFFLFSIAWDLLPDAALKQRIAGTARRIMDHILDNGYNLTDLHGQPTYWGRWSPDYFASARGRSDSPLNAVEL